MDVQPTKAPATIGIDASYKNGLVETYLDNDNFMYLGKSSAQRDELFLFAMALGWKHKVRSRPKSPCSGGFIRLSSCPPRLKEAVNLVRFSQSDFASPNDLLDEKGSYQLAEDYVDAGLSILQGDKDQVRDSETYANGLIAEMNEMYKHLIAADEEK